MLNPESLGEVLFREAKTYIEERLREEGEKIVLEASKRFLDRVSLGMYHEAFQDRITIRLDIAGPNPCGYDKRET